MNTLKDRIAIASAGMPRGWKAGLAVRCGVSKPSVSDWASGNTASIDANNLFDAADFFGVNPNWLATGEGPMRQEVGNEAKGKIKRFPTSNTLESTIERLVGYLKCVPEHRRKAVGGILESLALHPDDHLGCVVSLKSLLSSNEGHAD